MTRTRARKRRPTEARLVSVGAPPPAPSARRYIVGGKPVDGPAAWRWKTFPVYFVFAATLFLASALCTLFAIQHWYAMIALLTLLAAIPLAVALAHLVTLRYVAPHAPRQPAEDDR